MRTPDEQEHYLEHERFGEDATGKPLPKRSTWLRVGCISLAVFIVLPLVGWMLLSHLGQYFTETVAREERGLSAAPTNYGYSVEKYRWQGSGVKVHLWSGASMDLVFDAPELQLANIRARDWLAGGRAIFLDLECAEAHHSYTENTEIGLLYDFERGELHTCGDANPWLARSGPSGKSRRMSCDDLRTLAKTLE